MAGHSKFKNIMHRKGAQDKKRSAMFAKFSREILVAAKMGGADIASNTRLRLAVQTARANSMPKDNIDRAIKKATGGSDLETYEEVRYEGFGTAGIAVIVDCLTDNRNRTAGDIRSLFSKAGGNLGESNSVAFSFDRLGQVHYPLSAGDNDKIFEIALESGADDVESGEFGHDIFCKTDDLHQVAAALEQALGEAESVKLVWRPQNYVSIENIDKAKSFMRLIDNLEDHDDVQQVTSNADIPDNILAELE